MRKHNLIKKVALLGATVAMVMGMVTNVMAATSLYVDEERIDVGNNGYADCYVQAGASSGIAETLVYAYYDADYIYAYAKVDLTETYTNGHTSSAGSDTDSENTSGYSAYASAYITESSNYNTGTKANSTHNAEIDGISVGCMLYAEY